MFYHQIVMKWMEKNGYPKEAIEAIIKSIASELQQERIERDFKNSDEGKPGRA